MGLALDEAENAMSYGEVPVGSVIVSADGQILAQKGNRVINSNDPTAHAEILAIRAAARLTGNERLGGCVPVATLEPCLMCAAAIVEARLAGVVFGALDTEWGALVSRNDYISITRGRKIWHLGGIRSQECASLLNEFFSLRREDNRHGVNYDQFSG